jgi:hypothetical protein
VVGGDSCCQHRSSGGAGAVWLRAGPAVASNMYVVFHPHTSLTQQQAPHAATQPRPRCLLLARGRGLSDDSSPLVWHSSRPPQDAVPPQGHLWLGLPAAAGVCVHRCCHQSTLQRPRREAPAVCAGRRGFKAACVSVCVCVCVASLRGPDSVTYWVRASRQPSPGGSSSRPPRDATPAQGRLWAWPPAGGSPSVQPPPPAPQLCAVAASCSVHWCQARGVS